ncbi:MAG: hypothetical protein PUP93_25390 [Rhizonema sp. NSF051]|nr:hypothetical protein [Rhizonema sp. NSF051]
MKNKGGRGMKNEFSTVVMRVPAPLSLKVKELISEFYESQKPVTSIETNNSNPVTGIVQSKTLIKILRLHNPLTNILRRENIRTIEQLENLLNTGELQKIRGIGKMTVESIGNALLRYRLHKKVGEVGEVGGVGGVGEVD